MFINSKVYDALIGAHMREVSAMNDTIKAKAMEHLAKRGEKKPAKPYQKLTCKEVKAEDNREELRNDNRDEDNHYHKMPEE